MSLTDQENHFNPASMCCIPCLVSTVPSMRNMNEYKCIHMNRVSIWIPTITAQVIWFITFMWSELSTCSLSAVLTLIKQVVQINPQSLRGPKLVTIVCTTCRHKGQIEMPMHCPENISFDFKNRALKRETGGNEFAECTGEEPGVLKMRMMQLLTCRHRQISKSLKPEIRNTFP